MIDFNQDVEQCLAVLSAGGLILYPTDTVWGLGCDATNEAAVQKLLSLKGKPAQKGLIVLLASERDVLQWVAMADLSVFDYLQTVQKPTTVIYDGGLGVASNVLNADGSIAIRLVNEPFCRHLIKRFRKPIVSTSANFHGAPAAGSFQSIDPLLEQQVDYAVQYRRTDEQPAVSSSIIRWKPDGKVDIIRQ